MNPSATHEPDDELRELAGRYLDNRLSEAEAARLNERLRLEPDTVGYMAGLLRLEAALHDAHGPHSVELTEIKRLRLSFGEHPTGELTRQISARNSGGGALSGPLLECPAAGVPSLRRRFRWLVVAILLVAAAGTGWWQWAQRHLASPAPLVLANPGFEATDLSLTPRGVGEFLAKWEDTFRDPKTTDLCEIARVSGGTILPKSGRNVARLHTDGYLIQSLHRADGTHVTARPGARYRVSGWCYSEQPESTGLEVSLRVVTSPQPDEIQYQPAFCQVPIGKAGWLRFTAELIMPENLECPPIYISTSAGSPPALDVTGRELLLTLDNRGLGWLLLDDLEISEIR
ncbi:MAG: hypothetical protein K9N23_01520 [Akkermansiaceae bacterium]|nr:hypothetical protein [Akkermansiaceae bacterium]MCF7730329.1 hypothetical protein [Akkermansiaceae bacterium]